MVMLNIDANYSQTRYLSFRLLGRGNVYLCWPAAGRLIRHQKDYGAVILLDHRYNVLKFRHMTPAWLQPLLKSAAMADAPGLLHTFFCRTPLTK